MFLITEVNSTHCYLRTTTPRCGFRGGALSRFRRNEFPITIVSSPRTARTSRLGSHREMSDMADTSECFASETISSDGREVFELLQFRSRKSLAQDGEVIPLHANISNPL
jgi:hypothetical protein